eukprot:Lithocolla_globosa_v1_NODE_5071_length_1309_cov_356.782297.p1 type:complete len:339 gc:universal NODE_5071_length_1309_cov_356.782297:130-1146(+)
MGKRKNREELVEEEEEEEDVSSSSEEEDDSDTGEGPVMSVSEMIKSRGKKKQLVAKTNPVDPLSSQFERKKVLMLASRGITHRYRHLMKDLHKLMPHVKADSKLDSKSQLHLLNELADLHDCNYCVYFETRKHSDLYMWISKPPLGPSVKMYIQNVHTMDELKLTGNCLMGSRPLLSFDKNFDTKPYYKLLKELLTKIFSVPPKHKRSKPFVDHVLSFSIVDNRIWFRNFEIKDKTVGLNLSETNLVEIGPRFVMTPIRIFQGSFGGPTLYQNDHYVSPNEVRRQQRAEDSSKYASRKHSEKNAEQRKKDNVLPEDELDTVFQQNEPVDDTVDTEQQQ